MGPGGAPRVGSRGNGGTRARMGLGVAPGIGPVCDALDRASSSEGGGRDAVAQRREAAGLRDGAEGDARKRACGQGLLQRV